MTRLVAEIVEEEKIGNYFSSSNITPELEQYKPIFGYLALAKEQKFEQKIPMKSKRKNWTWLSIAASIVVLLGIGTFTYDNYFNAGQDENLGTYDDPKIAFLETQKALSMLSSQVNVGIGSVQ